MNLFRQGVCPLFYLVPWGRGTQPARVSPCVSDPFKLFSRLLVAFFKIAGYGVACGIQSLWYIAHGKSELVGDAIGYFGRDVTNVIADVFRRD